MLYASTATATLTNTFLAVILVELGWFFVSELRRQQLLSHLRSPKVQQACAHAHKPLLVVALVYAAVWAWSLWAQYSTGATVDGVYLDDDPAGATGARGNVWTWKYAGHPSSSPVETRKLIVLFPGAGFGAVPYARFARAMSTKTRSTVVALEDPREFCAHHMYWPSSEPCLTPRQWHLLYMHACMLSRVSRSEDIGVFAHSNGSFRAAFVCKEALTPPSRALFYEPTALRADWLQDRVSTPPSCSFLGRASIWMINNDEAMVKAVVSCQSKWPYYGYNYIDERLLLVSSLRPEVDYALDTADDDYVMSTSYVDARLAERMSTHPGEGHAKMRRFRHGGDHAEFTLPDFRFTDSAMASILQGWAEA
jgi:hypothetical protein